jgi:hypothetical protein
MLPDEVSDYQIHDEPENDHKDDARIGWLRSLQQRFAKDDLHVYEVRPRNVTCIAHAGQNVSNTTWIGNVFGTTTVSGTTAR